MVCVHASRQDVFLHRWRFNQVEKYWQNPNTNALEETERFLEESESVL